MYRTVLKQMDEGTFNNKAEKKYEDLYQEFKTWGKPKSPAKMEIHVDNVNPATTRTIIESKFLEQLLNSFYEGNVMNISFT